ncbi:MAG: hypothetical protein LBP65_02730 [Puniceicoccales bacterium]|jgi:hypothetical protein|nr:hypothetical protein [Puniceicoccales bacterium]
MKKTAVSLTLAGVLGFGALHGLEVPAFQMPPLTVDAKIGFNTEYVNHGRREGEKCIQMAVETGLDFGGGHGYIGATSALMLADSIPWWSHGRALSMNNISPYIGYSHDLANCCVLDIGYTAHLYTNVKPFERWLNMNDGWWGEQLYPIDDNSNEFYIGVTADVVCSPKLYLAYDFNRKEFDLVGSIRYGYDLTACGLNNFSLEGKAHVGYDYAKRPFGVKNFFKDVAGIGSFDNPIEGRFRDQCKDYFYFGLGADLVYKYNEQSNVRIGARYEVNSTSKNHWNNALFGGGHKGLIWFSSAVEFSF